MLDKNGNEICVGDTILYAYENNSKPPTKGIVVAVVDTRVFAHFEDDLPNSPSTYVNAPHRIEVIKPNKETFSAEDEKLLQELTERKARVLAKQEQIEQKLREAAAHLYLMSSSLYVFNYFKDKINAEGFIQTLKEFHDIK